MKIAKVVLCGLLCVSMIICALSVSDIYTAKFFSSNNTDFSNEKTPYNSDASDIDSDSIPNIEELEETVSGKFDKETEYTADFSPTESNDIVSVQNTSPQASENLSQAPVSLKNTYYDRTQDTPIMLNSEDTGVLESKNEKKVYSFALSDRGVLRYSMSHPKTSSGESWIAELYQKYNSNGFDGEEKWRLLNRLETNPAKLNDISPNLGLYKGEYRIVISSGQVLSTEKYTLKTEYTAGSYYEIECNDSLSRYNEVFPDIPIKGSSSSLGIESDNDWYMFRLNKATRLNIIFEHTKIDSISVHWRIALYDINGNEVFADSISGSATLSDSGDLGLSAGCYFIGVSGRVYTDFDYTLTVKRSETDCYETEANNTFETADEFLLNSQISAALIPTGVKADKDVFRIEISEAGSMTIGFVTAKGTEENYCWRVSLYDINSRCIWQNVVASSVPNISSPEIGVGSGTYFVVIDNDGLYKSTDTYALSNLFTAADNWENEYNDTPETASEIYKATPLNGTIVNREIDYDDDYFVFDVTKDAVVEIWLTHEPFDGEKDIFAVAVLDESLNFMQILDERTGKGLLDVNGQPVVSFNSSENTENVSASYFLTSGRYYIRLRSGRFSSDTVYNLYFDY